MPSTDHHHRNQRQKISDHQLSIATDHRLTITRNRSAITHYPSPIINYHHNTYHQQPIMVDYRLQTTDHRALITVYGLPLTCTGPPWPASRPSYLRPGRAALPPTVLPSPVLPLAQNRALQ